MTSIQPSSRLNEHALMDLPRVGEPASIIVFGASGDLTRRKLVPALYNLTAQSLFDERSQIIGIARRDKSDEQFRAEMESGIREFSRLPFDRDVWDRVAPRLRYLRGDFGDSQLHEQLARTLKADGSLPNRLYYMATPPAAFGTIVGLLKAAGLTDETAASGFARIVVEKPFGHDLASAVELNDAISDAFREEQIFRIDHYLGKETVQNVLVFRLGNGIFEPLWNRRYVDHVQITAAEAIGVEGRAGYFDGAGSARDMLQSHLLQLLTLVAMEPPVAFDAQAVHDEKVKVLRSIRDLDTDALRRHTVRAQYRAGAVAGTAVPGYREEDGVASGSMTETYVAARLELDNWRWAGVPFYLRTGKRLAKRATEVCIVFKQPPFALFAHAHVPRMQSNVLRIRIQPDEGISLKFACKVPGYDLHIDPVQMDFLYSRAFGIEPPEAYERLLIDVLGGDSTLFARIDEVRLGWQLTDTLRACWADEGDCQLAFYEAGTWGPAEADRLLGHEGRRWRRP